METVQIIIQFIVFFVLVDLVSKRYTTLFLLFFVDAYFFNLWGRLLQQVYTQTDISYVSQSLAQPFIKIYETMIGHEITLNDQQFMLIFLIVWAIIIVFAVIEHGVDNHYLKRYHVKTNIKKMREQSKNSKIQFDFVNPLKKSYQFIYLDSISYLHIFSYQYHVSKNKCINQRIKIDTIRDIVFKEVSRGYQLLIYTNDNQILDGGTYHEKYYSSLSQLKEMIEQAKEELQARPTIVFGKKEEGQNVTKL